HIDAAGLEHGVLRHHAERPDLAPVARNDANPDDASESDGDAPPDPHVAGLHDTAFDGVSREVNALADDDPVTELEQVVVGERHAVDVHALPDACTVESQVPGPERRTAKERADEH